MDQAPARNVHDVQCFLEFANFYLRFIKDFSKMVTPITLLLWKNTTYTWKQEAQSAFDLLMEAFTLAPTLVHPDLAKPFLVKAGVSSYVIRAVLS